MQNNKTFLGIELGSTRIKSVLIDENFQTMASGGFEWENRLENGIWTYHLDDVWTGLQTSFRQLAAEFEATCGEPLTTVSGIGISAMMHGYLPFDKEGKQLAEFRTWRNTTTEQAATILTEKFGFNIPLRWSIAHLYQAMLNGEDHVRNIAFLTTLAGYVHYELTGEKVLGIGDASGMFPIDSTINDYHPRMLAEFGQIAAGSATAESAFDQKLTGILPKVLMAGENAGLLTEKGARLLDPTGKLKAGIPLCPPEGDAGTGMVATNSVSERTGNISAGTSVFAMIVLEKELSRVYPKIDMVTTPDGKPVAMAHCNNCSSDIDAWVRLCDELLKGFGVNAEKTALYNFLYNISQNADPDCGGLLSYNYYSGEPVTGLEQGRPLFVRTPDSKLTLANFFRNLLFSAVASLKIGMNILTERENVVIDRLSGHGGLFKTKDVGQKLVAAALNAPVIVSDSAGEGGAWGIAILAAYMEQTASMEQRNTNESLGEYLAHAVFKDNVDVCALPDRSDVEQFNTYLERYKAGLAIEKAAVESLK